MSGDGDGSKVGTIVLYTFLVLAGIVLLCAVGGIVALFVEWGSRAVATTPSDIQLPSILLAAASLFILVFSVLIGLGAAFGWRGLRDLTAHRVREKVEADLEALRRDSRMHVNTTRAFIYQKRSYEKYAPGLEETIRVTDGELLNEAIATLESVLDEAPDDHSKLGLITNNLAFLLAVRGEDKDAVRARTLARELREDHYREWDDHAVINTCARIVAVYHSYFDDARAVLKRSASDLEWVIRDGDCPRRESENARRHLQEVRRALQDL